MEKISLISLMKLRPSSDATSHSFTKEFPNSLQKMKVHYHVHKNLQLIPILNQINPVQIKPSYFS
jgi:hypothetical protein